MRLALKIIGAVNMGDMLRFQLSTQPAEAVMTILRHFPKVVSRDYQKAVNDANVTLKAGQGMYKAAIGIIAIAKCLQLNLAEGANKEDTLNLAICQLQAVLGDNYGLYATVETKNYEHQKLRGLNDSIMADLFFFIETFLEEVQVEETA